MIIDAHQHFWRISRGVYDWIDAPIAGLRRDFFPEHLGHYLAAGGIDKTILVQASETIEENTFLLEMAEQASFVGGIVAWLDLSAPDAVSQLERLAQIPLIKGVRPVLQGIEETDWILRPEVLDALSHLPRLGLRFDALTTTRHLPVLLRLVEKLPELAMVIDHAAKPVIAHHVPLSADWRTGMQQLAAAGSVHCKLSGLAFEQGRGWTREGLQPVADHLLETFGPSRVMWGSDWPVLEHVGSYVQWFDCVQEMIQGCCEAERGDVLGNTAARFYGLTPD